MIASSVWSDACTQNSIANYESTTIRHAAEAAREHRSSPWLSSKLETLINNHSEKVPGINNFQRDSSSFVFLSSSSGGAATFKAITAKFQIHLCIELGYLAHPPGSMMLLWVCFSGTWLDSLVEVFHAPQSHWWRPLESQVGITFRHSSVPSNKGP